MIEPILNKGERIDGLPAQNIHIIQNPDMFSYSLDAILLAHFAGIKGKGAGLTVDLGAGTGAVGLFYAPKVTGKIKLVEIQPELADMAARSIVMNGLEERVSVLKSDMKAIFDDIAPGSAETVLSNPPYFPLNETTKTNKDEHYELARHELTIDLPGLAQVANKLLKNNGKFYMVHRPERLSDIFAALSARKLMIKRIRFVYGKVDREANMVLVEAIKSGRPGGVRILPPIIAYTMANDYTAEVKEILYGASWTK
ncbi:tRNA1(Val) (adenine(37)-N6)-methyltransferase [Leuconostoc carnosum]|uniref:RNA methyltransferase n=2 Tax=Leuconostoc carnosum TaxID=1252 RepID=K0DDJ2_LEUCJ|nr:tRNA1(Val) (adenine(37)-N6)-methyltransferase [Leuconostoc carnosum]AFT81612.1 RNA methyltransferase [Leuconostoc carnosum JB16]KAA8330414.1 tRNA1(Val) (adenine(37)-N6)-methyltransferase [Leuconostoc carnosum]KAA8370785.1 tRNA1(Val) (adenine(37)-N6)-methyltransferase [Leuconostoc carnosum]KAA8374044.1 tRNA1(Val) (adenine(37)-N6)-methyltransferase [Leuconostoc carnosum]KAA8381361.1 tRNA1(Val) (adenine(37)-N6)-methyltransferase [Leuconostoc carnosum]